VRQAKCVSLIGNTRSAAIRRRPLAAPNKDFNKDSNKDFNKDFATRGSQRPRET